MLGKPMRRRLVHASLFALTRGIASALGASLVSVIAYWIIHR